VCLIDIIGGVSHSAFLNASFCKRYWIPVLRGNNPTSVDLPENPPWYLHLLSVIKIKYAVLISLAVLAAFLLGRAQQREVIIPASDIYFAGDLIQRLVAQTEEPCIRWYPDLFHRRRCMITTEIQDAATSLVLCHVQRTRFIYRDPALALEELQRKVAPCLKVEGVVDQRLRVRLNPAPVSETKTTTGKSLWLCGCSEAERNRVLEISNRGG
jgi:hypothetical protein